jgi:4-amino-4-deoxy-L-arabinose transferase-like glycosyltransferase
MKRTELFVLLLILAIAAGFRLYNLHSVPPGLYPDEAMNGTNAIQAWESGHFRIFYADNNGREGLFINLQAISVHFLGNTAFALRLVSAIIGILTVLGTYLLARRMFDNWEIAALAAFLMATGFWHVNFSRIGFRAIMAPFCAVWALYYLWTALRSNRLWHWALAGFWLGLGFHTYIAFRVMPAVVAVVILVYLWSLRSDFRHDKYIHTRHQLWGGMALMVGVMIVVLLPMAAYFYANPGELIGRTAKVSVFAGDHPWRDIGWNIIRTVGMFVFSGDTNWRHNIAGQPILSWPVAVLFTIGFIRLFLKIGRSLRTHGHPSIVHTLILSWFVIGLIPAVLSNEGIPHALRSLVVAPAVYIIAAEGLWWLYVWLRHWYGQRDVHRGEGTIVVTAALIAVLLAIGTIDASRYFFDWAMDPNVKNEFTQRYVETAAMLNALPPTTPKYVVASRGDVFVGGIPVSAQTVMFLTDTGTPEKQKAKQLFYLTKEQFIRHQYPRGALLVQLDP